MSTTEDEWNDSDDSEEEKEHHFQSSRKRERNRLWTGSVAARPKKKKLAKKVAPNSLQEPEPVSSFGFCCAFCKCTNQSNETVQSGDGGANHRFCCHKVKRPVYDDWKSSVDKVIEEVLQAACQDDSDDDEEKKENNKQQICLTKKALHDRLKRAKSEERRHNSEQCLPDPLSALCSSELYTLHLKSFRKVQLSLPKKRKAVVLDMFSGIGAGIVALKRLGLRMKTVICVEHDPIARHVFRHNHDSCYNRKLKPNRVLHVYYPSFEYLAESDENLSAMIDQFGPVDIVLGGPPCQDYSAVNAHRRGAEGRYGRYLHEFGRFIRRLEQKQGHKIYFMAENVNIMGFKDMSVVEEAFQTPGLLLDAKEFSPCRRNRHYFLNFPVKDVKFEGPLSESHPETCLEEGWFMPADLCDDIGLVDKANTFMASKSRINDDRMMRVRPEGSKYVADKFSVLERERMLGFPDGYVSEALDEVFEAIRQGFMATHYFPAGERWMEKIDPKYHLLSGGAYSLRPKPLPECLEVLWSPPQVTKTREFFNKEDYGKHLLGNSFSIPVVQHLLERLIVTLFKSKRHEAFEYPFPWVAQLFKEEAVKDEGEE